MRIPNRGVLLALLLAVVALVGFNSISTATPTPPPQQSSATDQASPTKKTCDRTFIAPTYRKTARRVYHQRHRIVPKQHYRLAHMRKCARSPYHRERMRIITRSQSRARAARRAAALRECGSRSCNRRMGKYMAARVGWTGQQWRCLDSLWGDYESNWNETADNPNSTAYGIPQALPGSRMGPGWVYNVVVQIRWGISYVRGRYGTPCGALSERLAKGWY